MLSSKSATKPKSNQPTWEWSFSAIGTQWWIGTYEPLKPKSSVLQSRITSLIDEFDATFSRFRADSLVMRMSKRAGSYGIPAYAASMLELYRQLYDLTEGRMTPLVGRLLSEAGYDARYSLQPSLKLHDVPAWDEVLQVQPAGRLLLRQPALLDFGAAGKGFLVDLVSDLLRQHEVQNFCVDASGDMYVHGLDEPLKIGLENPNDTSQIVGVASLANGALCGSAPNRRAWGDYHHIMDPHTKNSVQELQAVWVQAPSALLADALTTALFFASPAVLQQHFEFAYALVYADGSLQHSSNFLAEFFS